MLVYVYSQGRRYFILNWYLNMGIYDCWNKGGGGYNSRIGNYILYYNFSRNWFKFLKVYIIRMRISQRRQWWCWLFFTKLQKFWENHKNRFLSHFFQNQLQKIANYKSCLYIDFFTYNIHLDIEFSFFFVSFCRFF